MYSPVREYRISVEVPLGGIQVPDSYAEERISLRNRDQEDQNLEGQGDGNLVLTPDYSLFFEKDREKLKELLDHYGAKAKSTSVEVDLVFWVHDRMEMFLPPLSRDEYAQLEENIKLDGCRDPIAVTPDGCVVDGHNRISICFKNERSFEWVLLDFCPFSQMSAIHSWAGANQIGRRNEKETEFSRFYYGISLPILAAYEETKKETGLTGLPEHKRQQVLNFGIEAGLITKDDRRTAQVAREFGQAINYIEECWGTEERHQFLLNQPLLKSEVIDWFKDFPNLTPVQRAIAYWFLKRSPKRKGKGTGGYSSRYEEVAQFVDPATRFHLHNFSDEFAIACLINEPENERETIQEIARTGIIVVNAKGEQFFVESPSKLTVIQKIEILPPASELVPSSISESIASDPDEDYEEEDYEETQEDEDFEDEEEEEDEDTQLSSPLNLEFASLRSNSVLEKVQSPSSKNGSLSLETETNKFVETAAVFIEDLLVEASGELSEKIIRHALKKGVSETEILAFYEERSCEAIVNFVLKSIFTSVS